MVFNLQGVRIFINLLRGSLKISAISGYVSHFCLALLVIYHILLLLTSSNFY